MRTGGPELGDTDEKHLDAAEGWLGLGVWREALAELEAITEEKQTLPEVLCARSRALAEGEDWCAAALTSAMLCVVAPYYPYGWIRLGFALYKQGKLLQARNALLLVVDQFKEEEIIPWHLALYTSQLDDMEGAKKWFKIATARTRGKRLKKQARELPELEPLWTALAGAKP